MTKLCVAGAVLLVAGVLILGTGACGSGGGGDAVATPHAFFGPYWFISWLGADSTPDFATSRWGTFGADGFGTLDPGVATSNTNGVISGPMAGGMTDPYTLDANGTLILTQGGLSAARGGVASDGSAAAVSATFSGIPPFCLVFCRRQGTFNVGSLDGLYHFVLFAYDAPNTDDIARWGTITFNNGAATVDRMNNVSGLISSTLPFAANYFVAADGAVDLTMLGESFRGGLLEGGDLAVLGGSTTAAAPPVLLILVRGSTTASLATFSGTYHAIGFEAPAGGTPEWISFTTTADANGVGGLDINAGLQNADGTVTALAPMSTTYTVAGDGTLSIAGGNVVGGVSPTGRYAIYGGSTVGGQGALLWFLLR